MACPIWTMACSALADAASATPSTCASAAQASSRLRASPRSQEMKVVRAPSGLTSAARIHSTASRDLPTPATPTSVTIRAPSDTRRSMTARSRSRPMKESRAAAGSAGKEDGSFRSVILSPGPLAEEGAPPPRYVRAKGEESPAVARKICLCGRGWDGPVEVLTDVTDCRRRAGARAWAERAPGRRSPQRRVPPAAPARAPQRAGPQPPELEADPTLLLQVFAALRVLVVRTNWTPRKALGQLLWSTGQGVSSQGPRNRIATFDFASSTPDELPPCFGDRACFIA